MGSAPRQYACGCVAGRGGIDATTVEGRVVAAALEATIDDIRQAVGEDDLDEDGIRDHWAGADPGKLRRLVSTILEAAIVIHDEAGAIEYVWKSPSNEPEGCN
ncbi:hypothetical protein [Fodinicola feengrottensis]|uniref:hypothetical protein n=1 Tax=Fodinicola feengrottensis TaxID=435914 RepID=UPI0024411B68|nr:hypothetical protein [Fodinicola feengrottensis]